MEIVQRNQPSQIKIEAIEYEGKPRIDVRLWVFAKQLDKMIPTRRGLSIRCLLYTSPSPRDRG